MYYSYLKKTFKERDDFCFVFGIDWNGSIVVYNIIWNCFEHYHYEDINLSQSFNDDKWQQVEYKLNPSDS